MEPYEELLNIADRLAAQADVATQDAIATPLSALKEAADSVGRAFSGSWLGYHACVYYEGFAPPPPGAHFSREWGLRETFSDGTTGRWVELNNDQVREYTIDLAGRPDLSNAREAALKSDEMFRHFSADISSILQTELDRGADGFLQNLVDSLRDHKPLTASEVANELMPRGKVMTRDLVALGQGFGVPPHMAVMAEAISISHSFGLCKIAADIARKAGSHLERKARKRAASGRVGTNVFIGHGRSPVWRDLKDFIQDRIELPWDEFNRVPVAGVTNIARLSEMLDAAAVAFIVMTAEDERIDGTVQARMNVIHEAGLFQGRLGFTKAIVMLEEGCQEFTNIAGLGQIRFPQGNISAAFEQVRQVLEREQLLA